VKIVGGSIFDGVGLGVERRVSRSSIQGVVAEVDVRLNEPEHARRSLIGSGAELRREVLDRVANLPVEWVPVREVEHTLLEFLDDAARDTIEIRHTLRGTQVRRQLLPPLLLERITVHARTWDRGFPAVNGLAGLAQRCLVLSTPPEDVELAELESTFYGIGLAVDRGGDLQTVTSAEPFTPDEFTTLAWQVAEQVYDSALRRGLL
jgi:hypothetical protein